jgi:hypothetical protein
MDDELGWRLRREADPKWAAQWAADPDSAPAVPRVARRALRVLVVSCLALIPWIVYLALTLPVHYVARQWRYAWVGFDVALLAGLAGTAWFGWRRRQVVIPLAVATAVLLVCDAWFDVMLARGEEDFWTSVAVALLFELPLALYLMRRTRQLLMFTVRAGWERAGLPGEPPPLHRLPLFGPHSQPSGRPGSGPGAGAAGGGPHEDEPVGDPPVPHRLP